ncbi:MAG: Acetyl esterase Axe7A precursor [Verrucomicrobiota bacterium]
MLMAARCALGCAAGALAFSATAAGADLNVLPKDPGGAAPGGMMQAHLMKLAFASLDRRDADYEQIKTPEQVAAWQRGRRESFLRAIGPFPARTPLNARVTGKMEFADYRLEKILFESQPGFFVSATLYLPLTPGPHPAVVHPTGHSEAAKARDLYQRASIMMAKNGVACLCYDPVGQGERRQLLGLEGKALFGTTQEHQLLGVGATLLGESLASTMIWDGMRAADYLESRSDIDPKRLGCAGISGGGTMSSYLGAVDERFAVSAPGCYLTGFRRLLETIGPQDVEQNLYNQLGDGLDQTDYVLMRAPRPTLIMTATRDFFDITGSWALFRQAKRFYGRLGFPERVDLIEADTVHGYPVEHRVGGARWFVRWFHGADRPFTESDFPTLAENLLNSSPDGQTLRMPGARSLPELQQEKAEKLAGERKRLWQNAAAALPEVRRLAGVRPLADLPKPVVTERGAIARVGYSIGKLTLEPEPGIVLPALLFTPEKNSGAAPVLYVHGDGKHLDAADGGPIEKLVRTGHRVLAVDLRGIGETGSPVGRDAFGKTIGTNSKQWTLAYLLGKSFVGMRAEDVLVCARYLAALNPAAAPARPLIVAGGEAMTPALHAVALESEMFSSVRLLDPLPSWMSIMGKPMTANQQINTVFGALRAYDLPDLIASLPKEKILLAGVNAGRN